MTFEGVLDVIEKKAWLFDSGESGIDSRSIDLIKEPDQWDVLKAKYKTDFAKEVEKTRDTLFTKLSDVDDDFAEYYMDNDLSVPDTEEGVKTIKDALRR